MATSKLQIQTRFNPLARCMFEVLRQTKAGNYFEEEQLKRFFARNCEYRPLGGEWRPLRRRRA